MPKIKNAWAFTVTHEGLKLENTYNSDTIVYLKRRVMFVARDTDMVTITNLVNGSTITIKRSECSTPPAGANMEAFLDALMSLASV